MSDMDPIVPCDAEAFTVHLDDRTGTWTRTTSHLPAMLQHLEHVLYGCYGDSASQDEQQ